MCNTTIPFYLKNFDWHPGEFIRDEMETLGYSQKELAEHLGISTKVMSDLLRHRTRISPEYAQLLSRVLDRSADYWISLENNWTASQRRKQENDALQRYRGWITRFHVKYLEKNGVIPIRTSVTDKIRELMNFFRIAEPACIEYSLERFSVSFRKRETKHGSVEGLFVWLSVGRRIVELQGTDYPDYDKCLFNGMLQNLRNNLRKDYDKASLQCMFKGAGISLVFVPKVDKNVVYGATYWHCGRPVIQMVCNYPTDDQFWFNLFHEASHVLDGNKSISLINLKNDEDERKADDYAAEYILPSKKLNRYINEHISSYQPTKDDIIRCAQVFNVPESIVLGRLQFSGMLPYSAYRELKKQVQFDSDIQINPEVGGVGNNNDTLDTKS